MENRDRDKISKSTGSTSGSDVNRSTSSNIGKKKDSSADFGKKIGRSEDIEREPSRHSGTGAGMQSDWGRSGGSSGFDSDVESGDLDKKSSNRNGSRNESL